jgi:hypothetical protein
MIDIDGERFHLTIPISEAVSFAMGWSDLQYHQPADELRRLVGILAVDALQYSEQWRAAALLQRSLVEKWPDLAG